MQHRQVTHRYACPQGHRVTGVGVKYRTFLNIAAGADTNPVIVAANDRAKPDTDIVSEINRAYDLCRIDHVGRRCNDGGSVTNSIDRHEYSFVAAFNTSPINALLLYFLRYVVISASESSRR